MAEHAQESDGATLDVAVDAVVATSGGDMCAAIRTLLVENVLLEDDVARISRLVSYGFTCGAGPHVSDAGPIRQAARPHPTTNGRKGGE